MVIYMKIIINYPVLFIYEKNYVFFGVDFVTLITF